jgi:hypothetical protein
MLIVIEDNKKLTIDFHVDMVTTSKFLDITNTSNVAHDDLLHEERDVRAAGNNDDTM